MPVPNKIKIFAWRACKDGLPTKENLLKKHVPIDGRWSIYNVEREDLYHALVSCVDLKITWPDYLPDLVIDNFSNVFYVALAIFGAKKYDMLATFFALMWGFWYRRNKWFHEQVTLIPQQAAAHASSLLKSYREALKLSRKQLRDVCKWEPPYPDMLKLNVDGAVFSEMGKARIGAILRNSASSVLMAASILEGDVAEPEHIEVTAVFWGLQLCASMGIEKIQVESDCLLAIEAVQKDIMVNSLLGSL
ncbi:hypothetical protein F2P56_019046, partial [Juglans regia]